MTTILRKEKVCALCGKLSEHSEIGSTSVFGSPDLDTRPPEMKRSTIDMWIQACPFCGYCAPDISEIIEKATEVVRSESYQRQLSDPEFPKLANAFLCFSQLQEHAGNFAGAGWASVCAAWVCDDAGFEMAARKCRVGAVSLWQEAKEKGQRFAEQAGAEEAIVVDLLRRAGLFELALKICEDGLKKSPDKTITNILQYQKRLINNADAGRHTVAEAIEGKR